MTDATRALGYLVTLPSPPLTKANTSHYALHAADDDNDQIYEQWIALLQDRSASPSDNSFFRGAIPHCFHHLGFYGGAVGFDMFDYSACVTSVWEFAAMWKLGFLGADYAAASQAGGGSVSKPNVALTKTQHQSLVDVARKIFPSATLVFSNDSNPEEGWTRPVLEVDTGIDDLEKLNELEEKFYMEVESHEGLIAALRSTTVSII